MNKDLTQTVDQISTVVLGKQQQIKLAVTSLICRGHLLIEDLPGMGKTTLAHAIAAAMGLSYNRIQFTSDMLPADIIGVNIFDKTQNQFTFHRGPLFSQLVLADEINRATPKAQSALLEAMEERQVSVEGTTYDLPQPFFVIATQNPSDQAGTFLLPESQLDRFFMRIHLGFPPPEAERELLTGKDRRAMPTQMQALLSTEALTELQNSIAKVRVSDALLDYVQRIIAFTRSTDAFRNGLSPRGGIALLRASQGWALLHGRRHVLPDDVQDVLPPIAEHRLGGASHAGHFPLCAQIIHDVPVI